jgi:hypothetical protein
MVPDGRPRRALAAPPSACGGLTCWNTLRVVPLASRSIARALQVYGALVADNSGAAKVFISGTPDPGWDDDDLDQLKSIRASALEAVVTGPVQPG